MICKLDRENESCSLATNTYSCVHCEHRVATKIYIVYYSTSSSISSNKNRMKLLVEAPENINFREISNLTRKYFGKVHIHVTSFRKAKIPYKGKPIKFIY